MTSLAAASSSQGGATPSRRDEQARETRQALVVAARSAFATHGYAGTSIDLIAAEAKVSKGAVYHHFDNKKELFRAVVHQIQVQMGAASGVGEMGRWKGDCWERFAQLCDRVLDFPDDSDVRFILLEGMAVFGWKEWRDIEFPYATDFIERQISTAIEAGVIGRWPIRPLAHFVITAMEETWRLTAHAADEREAREARQALQGLLLSLRL